MINTTEIEKAVVAMIMLSDDIKEKFSEMLKLEYFTDEVCNEVFKAIYTLKKEGLTIDILTVSMHLKKKGSDVQPFQVTELTSHVAQAQIFKFDSYCLLLQDEYIRKQLVSKCQDLILYGLDSGSSGIELADRIQSTINDITSVSWSNDKVLDNQTLMKQSREIYLQGVNDRINGIPSGVPTGIAKLDNHIGGWQRGHLTIIGGRPGMGKSRMLLQHLFAAAEGGFNPIMFTLEMPESDVTDVMVISQANGRIDPKRLRNRTLNDSEIAVKEAAETILSSKTYYLSSERNLNQIRAISSSYAKEKGTGIIFIDFIQKIVTSTKHANANATITEIASELKNLAKDLNIPVVSIASLSRAVEQRGGEKKPELQDLRDSGSIESEADMVLFAYRPAYYELKDEQGQDYTNEFFYIHGKGRFTEAADVLLYHDKYMARFFDERSQIDNPTTLQAPSNNLAPNRNFYEKDADDEQPF